MKIDVTCSEGDLAGQPIKALEHLADIAECDGADRVEWLSKALAGAGATKVSVPVSREPRYQPVEDVTGLAVSLYRRVMAKALEAVQDRVEDAVSDVDVSAYTDLQE